MTLLQYRRALILLLVVLAGAAGYLIVTNGDLFTALDTQKEEIAESEQFREINKGDYAGTFEAEGYSYIQRIECDPLADFGPPCEAPIEYAFFVIQTTTDPVIFEFIKANEGNAFVAPYSIGIGCYERAPQRVYSQNQGDDGIVENVIVGTDMERFLEGTQDTPVRLRATKPEFHGGSGAPLCYSHFRDFKILP